MVTRREFGAELLVAMAVPGSTGNQLAGAERPRKNALMHVGGDYHSVAGSDITARENLEYNLRHGVKHLTVKLTKRPQGGWDPDELMRMKADCDKYGVVFEAIRMDSDYIRMHKGRERDREVETIVGNIQKAAHAGVKIITYNWEVIPYRRNGKTFGRGSVAYSSFKLENDWKRLPLESAGQVTHTFLKRSYPWPRKMT